MPSNLSTHTRYRCIDRCLTGSTEGMSTEALLDACERDLELYADIRRRPSRSTLHLDIKNLRSGVLGRSAPILYDRATNSFRYEDPQFTFFKDPLSATEQAALEHTLHILRTFDELDTVKTLENLVMRLGGVLPSGQSIIHLDAAPGASGKHWRDMLFQSVLSKKAIRLMYHPFEFESPFWVVLSPYFLKEYNNRWFVIGYSHEQKLVFTMALDRIVAIKPSISTFHKDPNFSSEKHFEHIIGVSKPFNETAPQRVLIKAPLKQASYIRTKPLHHSQKEMTLNDEEAVCFEYALILNYELESVLLSMGEHVTVLEPESLRARLTDRLLKAQSNYP